MSASKYYKQHGDKALGDVCDIRGDGELKCLLRRVNGSAYWAKKSKTGAGQEACGDWSEKCRDSVHTATGTRKAAPTKSRKSKATSSKAKPKAKPKPKPKVASPKPKPKPSPINTAAKPKSIASKPKSPRHKKKTKPMDTMTLDEYNTWLNTVFKPSKAKSKAPASPKPKAKKSSPKSRASAPSLPSKVMKYAEKSIREIKEDPSMLDKYAGWFISEKIDGWHIIWDGNGTLYTKSKAKKLAVPDAWLERLPMGVALSGEVFVDGGYFTDTAKLQKATGPWSRARFHVFDVLNPEFRSLPFRQRQREIVRIVNQACRAIKNCPLVVAKQMELPSNPVLARRDILHYFEKVMKKRGEGVVITNPDSVYIEGKSRSDARVKIKARHDAEGRVVEQNVEGGKLKSLVLEFSPESTNKRVRFNLGIGFKAAERAQWRELFPIGTLVSFSYLRLDPKSFKPREARYLRLRTDIEGGGRKLLNGTLLSSLPKSRASDALDPLMVRKGIRAYARKNHGNKKKHTLTWS